MRNLIRTLVYYILNIIRTPLYILRRDRVSFSNKISKCVDLRLCDIGKYNYIAKNSTLYNVKVGNYCCFGPDIHIGGMQHSYWWYSISPILSDECKSPERTIIGNDVWIGAQAIIKQGVKIGDGAVIGANSFVNKDVEPYSIVVGSPAKHLKYRFDADIQARIQTSNYWNYPPAEARKILESLKQE